MDVTVLNRQRTHPVSSRALSSFVRRLAEIVPGSGEQVAVCLVSDRRMRQYNREFRRQDRTTDVLSFPGGDEPLPEGGRHLGDIVISVPRAAEQARDAGHSLARELRILLLHGYLHLLGHDHHTDDGTMMRLERRLLRRMLVSGKGKAR